MRYTINFKTMKKLFCVLLFIIPSIMGMAQTGKNSVEITLLNQKGKTVKDRDIRAYVKGENPIVYVNDHTGKLTVQHVATNDTIAVMIRHHVYEFAANGTNMLELKLNRNYGVEQVMRNGKPMPTNAYKVIMMHSTMTPPAVDVNGMNSASQYVDLADYLTGRIPGLVIQGGPGNYQAFLDGVTPLVVVNGIRVQDFNAANMLLNPSDIASVSVDRDGTIYGSSGMNGVIIITTK